MDRNAVANDVAIKLASAEFAVDAAMADMAKLVGAVAQARIDLRISSATIDVAVTRASEAMAALAEARRAAGAVHVALTHVEQEFGLQTTGAGINKPAQASATPAQQANPLRVAR
jgi:hypothetical protein